MSDAPRRVLLDEAMAVAWAREHGYQVTGATIRSWAQRGHIHRHREEYGTMYDAAEILKYLKTRKRSA